jgi:hypothetical protein
MDRNIAQRTRVSSHILKQLHNRTHACIQMATDRSCDDAFPTPSTATTDPKCPLLKLAYAAVVVAENEFGRGIIGVIDGEKPKGVETEADQADRKAFLRRIGYKQ